jgi:hypothetical protein
MHSGDSRSIFSNPGCVDVPQSGDCGLTLDGEREMANLGVEVAPLRKVRREELARSADADIESIIRAYMDDGHYYVTSGASFTS